MLGALNTEETQNRNSDTKSKQITRRQRESRKRERKTEGQNMRREAIKKRYSREKAEKPYKTHLT